MRFARHYVIVTGLLSTICWLAACSALEPSLQEGCSARFATVYQPSAGSGGGQVRTIYTGSDCPMWGRLEVPSHARDVLIDSIPSPWRRIDEGPGCAASPESLGIVDSTIRDPAPNMYDDIYDRRLLDLMRQYVVLRIMERYEGHPGNGSFQVDPYLIAPPDRLDGLIEALSHRDINRNPSQLMPTGVSYAYVYPDSALHVYSIRNGNVHIISGDRATQCVGVLPDYWETGAFNYTDRHPAIECQIGDLLPEFDVRVSVPAQYHEHIGVLLAEANVAVSAAVGARKAE